MKSVNVQTQALIAQESDGLRLLLVALAGVVLFHGGLLPFTHGNTYDAYIHMFFGDHYHRSWFDPWEPRWYTGFATTSYPPGTHMAIGALMHLMPLRAAFVVVQLAGLLVLTVGVYRFALLWVVPRAAGYAAIAAVLASSISETVHLFGQLPTICSLGIFLNGLPYVYRWIVFGGWFNCAISVIFAAATTAAHHVTTIFGGVLFVLPLGLHALRAVAEINPRPHATLFRRLVRFLPPLGRGLFMGALMLAAIVTTVFPYWYWSITDPITQVPIPHGSRESFVERPDLGLVFFVIPWGLSILFLPYALVKTLTTKLWPLGMMLFVCVLLGTGGTTPLPKLILGGAFDILTLDRFTFWATILILPFIGLSLDGLLHGRAREIVTLAFGRGIHRLVVGGIFTGMTLMAVFPAVLPRIQPTQPEFVDPTPIARFMEEDEHNRWRYLTLGFGDQVAYLSAQMDALSVDGNYHSARRLPDLTSFSVERLENAKYLGVPGLGSLQQFVINAERYHLKYIFSNDAFYDPLLHFSGWTRLTRLRNGIVVWEKPDIPPLPALLPRRSVPPAHALMWGLLPPSVLILAGMLFVSSSFRRNFGATLVDYRPVTHSPNAFARPHQVRLIVSGLAAAAVLSLGALVVWVQARATAPKPPEAVIEAYFDALDFSRFERAFALLDPETRGTFDDVYFGWRWRGGLLASYGKLKGVTATPIRRTDSIIDWDLKLQWLTALDLRHETRQVRTVARDGQWYLTPDVLRPTQTPVRLQRGTSVVWNVVGRRQPRAETDLHRDRLDRPRIAATQARLVRHAGRYSVIGQVTNADADPAAVSVFADIRGEAGPMARQAAGTVNGQRLLPAESAGFRVDFDGVLSLQDALAGDGYDPTQFVPPEFVAPPSDATLEARALVAGRDLYRGVVLNAITSRVEAGQLVLEAEAVNTGTETASVTRVNVLLYDMDGRARWADAGYVPINIYPGQSSPLRLTLPLARDIEVIADIAAQNILTNGRGVQTDLVLPGAGEGTLPLPQASGYGAARLHVTSMTYDALF